MATSLIRGRWLLAGVESDGQANLVRDGALFQSDGEIVAVGPHEELRSRYTPDEALGSPNHLVIPGLINAHHHVGMTPFQMGVPDLPLETWLAARWRTRVLDSRLDTLFGCIKMIESGITTVMHNDSMPLFPGSDGVLAPDHHLRVLEAYREAGMRVAYSPFVRQQHPMVYGDDDAFLGSLPEGIAPFARFAFPHIRNDAYVELCEHLYREAGENRDGRTRILLAPGNLQWCSDELLTRVKECAAALCTGIHIHLAETIYQYAYARDRWDQSPVQHLAQIGFLGPEVSVAHAVWASSEDLQTLADTGTIVCTNPSSNLRLSSGIPRINAMLDHGVEVAIGIDEAGLNDDNDLLFEMRLGAALRREPGVETRRPKSAEQLYMATRAGARATGFAPAIGELAPGRRADVVLVDLGRIEDPYLAPSVGVLDALLHRGWGRDIDTVVIDGEVFYRDRRFTRLDRDAIFQEIREALAHPPTEEEEQRGRMMGELERHVHEFYRTWPAAKRIHLDRRM